MPRAAALIVLCAGALAGCAPTYLIGRDPAERFDVIVVPGCPTEGEGRLGRCLIGRAAWAATLWERGQAARFITSGGAVHSPYVEAEALAEAMTALGVPAERIWLERQALHTDENMYFSLLLARALG